MLIKFVFLLLLSRFSYSCVENCLRCNEKTRTCLECKENFQLSYNVLGCIKATISNCNKYYNQSTCAFCRATFRLINNTCIKDYSGCSIRNSQTNACYHCTYGTFYDNQKGCIGALNCAVQQYPCNQCRPKFQLIQQKCIYNDSNCEIVNYQGACIKCKNNYTLNGYQCFPDEVELHGCEIYENQFFCRYCRSSYYFYKGYCLYLFQIANIKNGRQILQQILKKYQKQKIQNCLIISSKNKSLCEQCQEKYFLLNGSCQQIFDLCLKYQNNKCTQCKFNFQLNRNKECLDNNCLQINPSSRQCIKCRQQFTLNQICIYKSDNCRRARQFECQECFKQFYLSGGICLRLPNKCIKVNVQNSLCKQCENDFVLDQYGKCAFNDRLNCLNYSLQGCLECKTQYQLNQNKICQKQKCDWIDSKGICKKCSLVGKFGPNCACQSYNYTSLKCYKCIQGYNLIQNHCYLQIGSCKKYNNKNQCIQCKQRSYLQSGLCVMVNKLCKQYRNNICTSCYKTYTLRNGSCIEIVKNPKCTRFSSTTQQCIQCIQNWQIVNDSCQLIKFNCTTSNSNGCLSCQIGYELDQTICKPIIMNKILGCQIMLPSGVCSKCSRAYYLSKGFCHELRLPCKFYHHITNLCISCYPSYILIQNLCFLISLQDHRSNPKCTHMKENKCSKCVDQYYINNTGYCSPSCLIYRNEYCVRCDTGHSLTLNGDCIVNGAQYKFACAYFSQQECLQCYPRYYLVNGHCQSVSSLCLAYSSINGTCLSCPINYFLQQGICILPVMGRDSKCTLYKQGFCKNCELPYKLINFRCKL